METALTNLEQSVQKTDSRLDLIAYKLDQYGREFSESDEPATEVSVLKLLNGVNNMKEEYESLKREISQVQELQKELTLSLRDQMKQVQGSEEELSLFDYLNPVHILRIIAAML